MERYIARHRDELGDRAAALSDAEKAGVAAYFSGAELARVRVVVGDPLPVADVPFAGVIRRLGFDFPSVGLTAAITFDDLIASREPMEPSLLFHELVHVVQYRLLGVNEFARLYVRGFLEERQYGSIPLERCAFELERRFVMEGRAFSVEREVAAWIERGSTFIAKG